MYIYVAELLSVTDDFQSFAEACCGKDSGTGPEVHFEHGSTAWKGIPTSTPSPQHFISFSKRFSLVIS